MSKIKKILSKFCVINTTIFTILLPSGAYGDINKGLVAHYMFEGDVKDSSGNGNHGKASDIIYENGMYGKAIKFNGSLSSYVEVPHSRDLQPKEELTISLWVKVTRYPKPYCVLIYKAGRWPIPADLRFADRTYSLWLTDIKGVHFTSTPENGSGQITCDTGYNYYRTNRFVHIAGIIDTHLHKMTIFVNGNRVKKCEYRGEYIRDGDYPLRIGGLGKLPKTFKTLNDQSGLAGFVDELRIYDRSLTQDEILSLADNP